MWISGGGTVHKENIQCKDPEWGEHLEGSRNSKEASVARAERARVDQKTASPEVRGFADHFVLYPV